MKELLDQMLRDSQTYYVPEGLPGRKALLDQLLHDRGNVWEGLSPMQNFFVFETAPDRLSTAPREIAQAAYCAAMESLPGDWWGSYSSPNSDTARRLLTIDGIDACLLRQLDNPKRVEMGDSEPATLAKLDVFQVADLAALFLATRYGLDYRIHASPEDRKARREVMRQQIEKQSGAR